MASLLKQHGRCYVQYYGGNREPKRKRVSLSTTRKTKARKRERRLTEAHHSGEFDAWRDDPKTFRSNDQEDLTLRAALSQFSDDKRDNGRAERAIENYERFIGRLIDEIGNQKIDTLSPSLLNEWIRDREVTDTTRHTRYQYVSAFLNHCAA